MRILATSILAVGIIFSNPAEAKSKFSIPVDESFFEFEFPFRGGGGYFGLARLLEKDGKVYLCGAGYSKRVDGRFVSQLKNAIQLRLDGKEIIRGVRYFTSTSERKLVAGLKAKCAETTARSPISKNANFQWDLAKTKFWE